MSRTYRNIAHAKPCARSLRHINYRRGESRVFDEIVETFGRAYTSNRLASAQSRIADDWDDYPVSAFDEIYSTTD